MVGVIIGRDVGEETGMGGGMGGGNRGVGAVAGASMDVDAVGNGESQGAWSMELCPSEAS